MTDVGHFGSADAVDAGEKIPKIIKAQHKIPKLFLSTEKLY